MFSKKDARHSFQFLQSHHKTGSSSVVFMSLARESVKGKEDLLVHLDACVVHVIIPTIHAPCFEYNNMACASTSLSISAIPHAV